MISLLVTIVASSTLHRPSGYYPECWALLPFIYAQRITEGGTPVSAIASARRRFIFRRRSRTRRGMEERIIRGVQDQALERVRGVRWERAVHDQAALLSAHGGRLPRHRQPNTKDSRTFRADGVRCSS